MSADVTRSDTRPLTGRRVVTTRDEPGELDERLGALGADVVHVPLIQIAPPDDAGAALAAALGPSDVGDPSGRPALDWVVVTSRHGADAVGAHTPIPARTAAVGTTTAAALECSWGRPVDLVPSTQNALGLVEAFRAHPDASPPCRILVARADRAEPTLVDGLRELGHDVVDAVAYRTLHRRPSPEVLDRIAGAEAVLFASGSAAEAWSATIGRDAPPVVCAIGPTTARVAQRHGLVVTHVAGDHSVDGLVATVIAALTS